MNHVAAIDEYLENQVLSASPHRLHLMVVDGAIRFARHALTALAEQRWEDLGACLIRSRNCVTELTGGVKDHDAPELAEQTRTIFLYVYRNLVVAELERKSERIEDALRLLALYRETWVELGAKLQTQHAEPIGATSVQNVPQPHLSLSSGRSWMT